MCCFFSFPKGTPDFFFIFGIPIILSFMILIKKGAQLQKFEIKKYICILISKIEPQPAMAQLEKFGESLCRYTLQFL